MPWTPLRFPHCESLLSSCSECDRGWVRRSGTAGANSHLIEQFLEDGTNIRTDSYGGSKENRARFLLDIVEEVSDEIGADRLAVRLSPFGQYGGIHDTKPRELFTFVIKELNERYLAYLHLIEARGSEMGLTDELHEVAINNAALFRSEFAGPLISAAAYTPDSAALAIEQKQADAIAFGRLFIANPDLVERIKESRSLNTFDRSTFYGGRNMATRTTRPLEMPHERWGVLSRIARKYWRYCSCVG